VKIYNIQIYKYQIFYLDRIKIVVNDIDLCRSTNRQKSIKMHFDVQGHSRSLNSVAIESQCTTSY